MPELPEVETVRRGLETRIVGKTITKSTATTEKSFPNAPAVVQTFLHGAHIIAVRRRAKVLLIDLSTNYSLMVHLKMTGQLVFVPNGAEERFGAGHPSDSLVSQLPDASTRVTIVFADDSRLYFNDQRKFGWMKLLPTSEIEHEPFFARVGPEPLEDDFTADVLWQRLQRRKGTTIKAAILDQTVLAGVGNIYADEGLWGAKIHPATRVRDVSKQQVIALWQALREVMFLSIQKGGSSNKNYVDAAGNKGSYMQFANVFRREGLPCSRHPDVLIEKLRVAGRGTHICPVCQPAP